MDMEQFDEDVLYQWEFKDKKYPHFDAAYCKSRASKIISDIKETGHLTHPFYPFIRFEIPKQKRDPNGRTYIDKNSPRYIMHTARVDANIYSYYRTELMNRYEVFLEKQEINDCVIAYRKIPINGNSKKGKCNVHFANEAMEEIKKQVSQTGECSAITMDISGFFDNLDHGLIKKQWCRIMGFENGLSKDHFTVFKNITRYMYVDAKSLERELSINFNKKLKNKQICTPDVFKKTVRPLILKKNAIGIPQGTPISDVIANMYMLDFDILMKQFSKKYLGYYRRYSDDILFVCPKDSKEKAIRFIQFLLKFKGKCLSINDKKTLVSDFIKTGSDDIYCTTCRNENEKIGKPFEYLGLSFDGIQKRIRTPTISAFYKKLQSRIKVEVNSAYSKLVRKGCSVPTENEIYSLVRFDRIYNAYMRIRNHKQKENYEREIRGNFHTYVQLVAKVTESKDMLKLFLNLKKRIKKKVKRYCSKKVARISLEKTADQR